MSLQLRHLKDNYSNFSFVELRSEIWFYGDALAENLNMVILMNFLTFTHYNKLFAAKTLPA